MIILLSPAKDLSEEPVKGVKPLTKPRLLEHSAPLAEKLAGMGEKKLGKLMDISPKLAALNHERYQQWAPPFTARNARPALFTFNGEAYRGLDPRTLDGDDLRFAQRHLRILSGLYGVLRPLDLMQAYRLEMGTKLSMGRGAKDLYKYWGDRITDLLNKDLEAADSEVVINLASNEYYKAVKPQILRANVITPIFKDATGKGYKVVMMYAKHQRGAMARYIIQHRILDAVKLKKYDEDGYRYAPGESSANEWVFLRDKR
jgi:cytoplasmic iron level regulating protein YaaA (DUF328/UPF0246 family)